jgi:hypothetical protein
MKQQGRKPINFPGKVDHHCNEPNWWEGDRVINKKSDRQQTKQSLRTMMQSGDYDE